MTRACFEWIAVAVLAGRLCAAAPAFEARGVLPSAGGHPTPLAPGLLFSIYGTHLGPDTGCDGQSPVQAGAFVKSLCDTQVWVGGVAAGLLYVQERQINFQVPRETPIEGTAEVRVVYQGQSSQPVSLPLGLVFMESPARVGMPVWLSFSAGLEYPFDVYPANFMCAEVEVRRDGKMLPRFASRSTQAWIGITINGSICGSLASPASPAHTGRLPLHLQYKFDRPGIYEVRYAGHGRQSAWTRLEILPEIPGQRAQWLTATGAHTPARAADLLTDFLPGILGYPDTQSLEMLLPFLYHADESVRRFAMDGLTYWPANEADARVTQVAIARGPSDVAMEFRSRWSRLRAPQADALVEMAIPYLQSDSPLLVSGAIAAMYRIALARGSRTGTAVRVRAQRALMDAATHVGGFADPEIASRYAAAMAMVNRL